MKSLEVLERMEHVEVLPEYDTGLTFEEAEELGIETKYVNVCRKLRRLARSNSIRLDENEHRSGLNRHLFDYLKYCGLDALTFIKMYLQRIQPYMIERRQDQEVAGRFICVVDKYYRVSVYIKVIPDQHEEVIVSFHEDNKNGIARKNNLRINKGDSDKVLIFADSVVSKVEGQNAYVVKTLFQRGLKELPIELAAKMCQDTFIVSKRAIELQFLEYCNQYIEDLYTSDLNLDFEQVDIFTTLQQISFTSYGADLVSSISLLIDSLVIQKPNVGRAVADFALVTYLQSLKLTSFQKDELMDVLNQKFQVTSIKDSQTILQRVQDNLFVVNANEL